MSSVGYVPVFHTKSDSTPLSLRHAVQPLLNRVFDFRCAVGHVLGEELKVVAGYSGIRGPWAAHDDPWRNHLPFQSSNLNAAPGRRANFQNAVEVTVASPYPSPSRREEEYCWSVTVL